MLNVYDRKNNAHYQQIEIKKKKNHLNPLIFWIVIVDDVPRAPNGFLSNYSIGETAKVDRFYTPRGINCKHVM